MEMIERYLEAVKFWLPKGQKDDIIEELSADIDAQVEERESLVGRALTEAEIETILKQRGRPVLVANRFLPQEQLIGPLLFPVYRFVLKIICLCYLLPLALARIGALIYDQAYRVQQSHFSMPAAIASAWSFWWTMAFISISLATLVFAVLERVQTNSQFLVEWSPRKLPPVRDPNKIPRATSVFELTFYLLFLACWILNAASRVVTFGEIRIEFSSLWVWFFSAYLLLTAGNVALSAANLLHPYWTIRRATVRLFSDAIGAALFCWLLRAHVFTSFSAASLSVQQSLHITQVIAYWTNRAFPWSVLISVGIVGADIYRMVRVKSRSSPQA